MEPKQPLSEVLSSNTSIIDRFREHPFAALETYKFFNQTEATLREYSDAVIDGDEDVQAPSFCYDEIDSAELIKVRDSLTELLTELPIDRPLTLEETLIRELITNRLDEVGLMLLTKSQSELSEDDPNYALISFQLGQNFREIYGSPDNDHFNGVLGYRLAMLSKIEGVAEAPENIKNAWTYIRDHLPTDLPIEQPYQMKVETMEWYKAQLESRLEPTRTAVSEAISNGDILLNSDGKLDAKNIVQATLISLAARGFDGWHVELTDRTGIDTTQAKKTIYIPQSRVMSLDEFDRVIQAHEIDEHVARRENGDASSIKVLQGVGLHGYLAFEEGNGKINEGLLLGKVNNEASAFGYFLNGGLALGLDRDGNGRNFRETHELVWRINLVASYLLNQDASEDRVRRHIRNATKLVHRLFRGTDGKTAGVVFTKDAMTYYLGGVEVMRKWDEDMLLAEEERDKEHLLERSAKFYPTRMSHRQLAQAAFEQRSQEIK